MWQATLQALPAVASTTCQHTFKEHIAKCKWRIAEFRRVAFVGMYSMSLVWLQLLLQDSHCSCCICDLICGLTALISGFHFAKAKLNIALHLIIILPRFLSSRQIVKGLKTRHY